MEDGEIDDSEINPVGETLIMEMAKRIEDHNNEVNMDNIDRMIVDKTLCVIGCNELHTKDILAFFKNFKPDKESVLFINCGFLKISRSPERIRMEHIAWT